MKKKFSLIVATYGREKEVEYFLKSIENSKYDLEKVEVIIVDQNETIDLTLIVGKYSNKFKINHIKSQKRGLSLNRNIGLKVATGDIIAFPDDDCEYLEDTLHIVNEIFSSHKEIKLLMGRIVERDGSDSLRTWSKEISDVNKRNFYKKCSSITMFFNKNSSELKFNEKLGAGQYFGACEDSDIIYKTLKNNEKAIYRPELRIYHPHYNSKTNMDISKIGSYGLGFGGFIKSNFDFYLFILFIKAEIFHLLKTLVYFLTFKGEDSKKSKEAFTKRISGFIQYKNQ